MILRELRRGLSTARSTGTGQSARGKPTVRERWCDTVERIRRVFSSSAPRRTDDHRAESSGCAVRQRPCATWVPLVRCAVCLTADSDAGAAMVRAGGAKGSAERVLSAPPVAESSVHTPRGAARQQSSTALAAHRADAIKHPRPPTVQHRERHAALRTASRSATPRANHADGAGQWTRAQRSTTRKRSCIRDLRARSMRIVVRITLSGY